LAASALIYETIVTTVSQAGAVHVAPMGVRYDDDGRIVVLMPFKPSTTLDNVLDTRCAVVNFTTDVRVFAGCVTGRRHWPTVAANIVRCVRLADCLAHAELQLLEVRDDPQRPTLRMQRVHETNHEAFAGFNRAQAAVIEGAVLVSRLHMLPREKVDTEVAYLQIAIDKTAGPNERTAWTWLLDAIAAHRAKQAAGAAA
jgi:hypothetical protein